MAAMNAALFAYQVNNPLIVSSPVQEEPSIIQTGLTQVEDKGRRFNIKVDPETLKELILYEANQSKDQSSVEKTNKWLNLNPLEINFSRAHLNPLHFSSAANFISPEFTLGRARISIREDVLKGLINSNSNIEIASYHPAMVLPHEIHHLLDYISSPRTYLAKQGIKMGEVIISTALAFLASKDPSLKGTSKILVSALTLSQTMTAFVLINLFTGISGESFMPSGEDFTTRLAEDAKFRELAYRAIEISPDTN